MDIPLQKNNQSISKFKFNFVKNSNYDDDERKSEEFQWRIDIFIIEL